MKNILNSLLGKSPFKPLQEHMRQIQSCVLPLKQLLQELKKGSDAAAKTLAAQISEHEHLADKIKDEIRESLSKSLFMPVQRQDVLEILSIQDAIADTAEDIGVLCTIKDSFSVPDELFTLMEIILDKSVETFQKYQEIIEDMDELLEATFSGPQAQKTKKNIGEVAYLEHETDRAQKVFLKKFFEYDSRLSQSDFFLIAKITRRIGDIANISEKAANKIRLILFS